MFTQFFSEQVQYVDLTPDLAKELLSKSHPNQRPVSNPWVRDLASAISNGEFIASQQCLQIDDNGKFFNGQHTCLAVIETGATLRHIKLETGCNSNAFVVADSGHNRSNVHRFKAATSEILAPSILSILKVLNSNWNSSSQSSKGFKDPYQRRPIELWSQHKMAFQQVFGLTKEGHLSGFKKQPFSGVAAAAIIAFENENCDPSQLYRWVHIATSGRPPKNMDQSISAEETATAGKWFLQTLNKEFNSRDTMNHFRRSCYGLSQFLEGNTPKSLRRVAKNPLIKS